MKPETLGEVHIIFQNIDEKMDNVIHAIKENTDAIRDLEVRVKTTNGQIVELKRVNKEDVLPLVNDYEANRERIKGAVTFGAIVATGVIALFMYTGKLYIDSKERTITDNVSEAVYAKFIKEFEIIINK
jgi:hypothetical protein